MKKYCKNEKCIKKSECVHGVNFRKLLESGWRDSIHSFIGKGTDKEQCELFQGVKIEL